MERSEYFPSVGQLLMFAMALFPSVYAVLSAAIHHFKQLRWPQRAFGGLVESMAGLLLFLVLSCP